MTPSLFDTPPTAEEVEVLLSLAYAVMQANVRPDDPENAHRAAKRVAAGRKRACSQVYAFLVDNGPVRGDQVVMHFLGEMRDPERRLRELREAMSTAGLHWRIVNVDGCWSIERTGL